MKDAGYFNHVDLREKGKVNSEAVSRIVFENYPARKTDEGQSG